MSDEFIFSEMTPELQAYLDHCEALYKNKGKFDIWKEKNDQLEKAASEDLVSRYNDARKVWACRDETASEYLICKSDSGKYELYITKHSKYGYSKCKVYHDGVLITEICRNYYDFPFLFIENHPNGNSYLICGEDYQGQTVVELNTGRKRNFLPKEAKKGHGFCWANYTFDAATQVLVVDGCYWACSYEFKFFDFSDPIEKGWPELELEGQGGYVYSDDKAPEIEGNIIRTFKSEWDEENEKCVPEQTRIISTWKREGLKLILQNEWISEEEQKVRKEHEENQKLHKAWLADFRANDPLYLAFKDRIKSDTWLKPSEHGSYGIVYDGWCPDFNERENRWRHRINESYSDGYTIDLEWAVKTGPIKLCIFNNGEAESSKFFPHSVDGMNAAFDYVKFLINSSTKQTEQ